MCKKLCFLMSVVLVLSLANYASAVVDANIPKGTPDAIDGIKDGAWSASERHGITLHTWGSAPLGDADLSASWWALWDSEYLYVLVDVNDSDLQNDSGSNYQDDSVELFVDYGDDDETSYGEGFADDHHFVVPCWGGGSIQGGHYPSLVGVEYFALTKNVGQGAGERGTGYTLEIKFPWNTVLDSSNRGLIRPMGFEVQIDDDDGGGNRDTAICWTNTGNNAWLDPSTFGVVELVGTIPTAGNPSPFSGSTIHGLVDAGNIYTALDFTPGDDAVSHEAFFSDVEQDVNAREGSVSLGAQATKPYYVGRPGDPYNQSLVRGTWYYWCVDEFDGADTWPGSVWSFHVSPGKASDPCPEDGRKFIKLTPKLCWTAGHVVEEHDVYFGTTFADVNDANKLEEDPEYMGNQGYTDTTWEPVADGGLTLQYNTDYYWRIDEANGTIKGDVWSFTTLDAGMEGTNAGRGAYIILITKSADSELEVLQPFLEGLYEGVSIEAVNEKYRDLHDEYEGEGIERAHLRANLKSANLIIISDASSAGEYDDIHDVAPAEGANLALNQPVDSNSNESTSYLPENAVDANTETRWASEANDPQWIYVDLGAELTVGAVRLDWEDAYGKSYQIQVSNNASDWTDVYSTTSGDGGTDRIYFEDVTARYVRMYGTERGTEAGYSLWEFGVYESGALPQEFDETDFWNGLETPILLTQNEYGEPGNWSWFDASGENDWAMEEDGGYLYYDYDNNMCDQIWDGVPKDIDDPCRVWMFWEGWFDSPPEVPTCDSAGYGTLLATADVVGTPSPALVLARWLPGTQFWDDPSNPQTAGGPRIFFPMEKFSDEFDYITNDGKELLENMMTELLQYTFDPNFAYAPYPKLNATDVPKNVPLVLSWSPGDNVGAGGGENGHQIFFSSNWADVNDHNEAALVKDPNFRDSTELSPPIYLEYGQTYYWCVDEYNDTHPDSPWLGHIWSFTMELSVTGEDWEDYASGNEMMEYWSETGGTTLNLQHYETGTVHGGEQAMYMNTYQEVGEATRTFLPPTEWADTYKAMGVWFYGDEENVIAGAQLYLTIEDAYYHNSATVHYDGDMSDLSDPNWHQWAIDLALFRNAGVDLKDVKSLTLGFGNAGENSSTIYFDDIELFEWMCLEPPVFDVTGEEGIPDCVVDVWDLGAFTNAWLEHEYYISAVPPTADPCAHWDLEEGTGDILADVTGNGNTGKFHVDCTTYGEGTYDGTNDPLWVDPSSDPCWVAAKMGNWALHFDGNDFIRVDDRWGAGEVDCPTGPFTICFWMNYDEENPGSMYLIYKGSDKAGEWLDPITGDPIGSEKRYEMSFTPGGTEGDSSLNMKLDDDEDKCDVSADELEMDPGVWYHVAMQRDYDAAKMRLYLNAEFVGEDDDDSQSDTIGSPNEPLFIGMKSRGGNQGPGWTGNRFVGKLDDIYLYKSVLSEEELLSVMGLSYRVVPVHHTEFNLVEDDIINFKDAAIMAENWGVNLRFP